MRALTLKLPGKSSSLLVVSSRLCALATVFQPQPHQASRPEEVQALRWDGTMCPGASTAGQIGLTTGDGHCSWALLVGEVWLMAGEVGALEIWSFQCLKLSDPCKWSDKKTCTVHLTSQSVFLFSHLIVPLGDRTKNLDPGFYFWTASHSHVLLILLSLSFIIYEESEWTWFPWSPSLTHSRFFSRS